MKPYIKPTNTQQYVHASSAHPPGTGKGIIKGELLIDSSCWSIQLQLQLQ